MTAISRSRTEAALFGTLEDVPKVDVAANLRAAGAAGRRISAIIRDMLVLRRGPGRLMPAEYLYYQLWNPALTRADKLGFVGKLAQHPMHMACNDARWYALAADKLLFHATMQGAGLPVPELLALTRADRRAPPACPLAGAAGIAAFLRTPAHYPLFAKPIDGKFSLAVFSAEGYDPATDLVCLHGADPATPEDLAAALADRAAGYVIQRRLAPHPALAQRFGPRLWSVRALVLNGADAPRIHRAVAKIATGANPADNFWRAGNLLGAIAPERGEIIRVVRGTGATMVLNPAHPDTGEPILGTPIPHWPALIALVTEAARLLPGIRTQSWDVALSEHGPVLLEVNFGGDLNLSQLAYGRGVLDADFAAHLATCGWRR